MNQEERLVLIDSLIDGSITEADLLRIEAELTIDPAVRQEYFRHLQLDMLLGREASENLPAEKNEAHSLVEQSRNPSWLKILCGSLVALAASMLMILFVFPSQTESVPVAKELDVTKIREPSASGFAVLDGQDNAVWKGMTVADGDLLPAGELHLKSGRVHIELFSGVAMVIEGDSLFSVDSPMQVSMIRGVASARVPETAQGFRIKTSSGDVVDLGTEFCVDVDDSGADVHVVDGEVELQTQGRDVLRVNAGLSRRLVSSGAITDAASPNPVTMGPREFRDNLIERQELRFSIWEDTKMKIETDVRTLAYYHFRSDGLTSREVKNLAREAPHPASDGTVVAATSTPDRWGQSDAARDFSRIGSRVRVNVPGDHRGLTMMCWVKINSLDRLYNSLFLTDGHEDREPHWQLMRDGRIFFSVKVPLPDGTDRSKFVQPVFYSPPIWDASLSGRWIMLAVTYDVDQQMVTHFLNGEPISSQPIAHDALVEKIRIGDASLCNWSEPMYQTEPHFVLRNLNGSMDEFALFSGALSDQEILHLYQVGNPNEL